MRTAFPLMPWQNNEDLLRQTFQKITAKTSISIYLTKTSRCSQDTVATSRRIRSQSLRTQSLSTQGRICLVFRGLPGCQSIPSPSHLSPTQRRGAGRRPTSAAGWLPEESNVTSGGMDRGRGLLRSADPTSTCAPVRAETNRFQSRCMLWLRLKHTC